MSTIILLESVTQGESRTSSLQGMPVNRTIQATVEGSGSVAATLTVQESNDGIGWVTVATIDLSGTTLATDRANYVSASEKIKVTQTSLSGTGAKCTTSIACN